MNNDLWYYDIISPSGKHCRGQYLTECMAQQKRADGYKLRKSGSGDYT